MTMTMTMTMKYLKKTSTYQIDRFIMPCIVIDNHDVWRRLCMGTTIRISTKWEVKRWANTPNTEEKHDPAEYGEHLQVLPIVGWRNSHKFTRLQRILSTLTMIFPSAIARLQRFTCIYWILSRNCLDSSCPCGKFAMFSISSLQSNTFFIIFYTSMQYTKWVTLES